MNQNRFNFLTEELMSLYLPESWVGCDCWQIIHSEFAEAEACVLL
jgi:hypothetical protein